MIKDGITYRNLENQVEYLTDYLNTEAQLVELGIKVVGTTDKVEDIPAGNYEYGNAYMVGTAEPYTMYVWTRADRTHPKDYWFKVGPFPMPGPQGPKGDGFEQIQTLSDGSIKSLTYGSQNGADITSNALVSYLDSTTGEGKTKSFTMFSKMPIVPGKYISMDATANNKTVKVKVDETALGLDFIKIDKTQYDGIPVAYAGKINWNKYTSSNVASTIVSRDSAGKSSFNKVLASTISSTDEKYNTPISTIYFGLVRTYEAIPKTATDTGTLTTGVLTHLQSHPSINILYNNQTYYRMDPINAPDGTLSYIHIDSVQDGKGKYKATGKSFSITVSTRAWQVVDLDFGATYAHYLAVYDTVSKNYVRFTLINNRSTTYTTANATQLIADVKGKRIPCTFQKDGTPTSFYAGMIQADTFFLINYGEGQSQQLTASQMTIEDFM